MSFDKINFNLANLGSLNNGFTSLDTTAMMQAMEPLFANSNINSNYMTAFDTFNINSMPMSNPYMDMTMGLNMNMLMPTQYNFDFSGIVDMYNKSIADYKNKLADMMNFLPFSMTFNTKPNESLKDVNFDSTAANRLAQNVLSHASGSSKGACAEYVSNAIQNSGIPVTRGHAYQMINNLKANKNFKEINVSKSELASLPAGCILVYPRGAAGYSSQYGHIEITLGNGTAASDFVNKNPKYSDQMRVFVPVTA